MTDHEPFIERLKHCTEVIREGLAPDGDWDPVAIIDAADGTVFLDGDVLSDEGLETVVGIARSCAAERISVVCSAWMVKLYPNEDGALPDPDAIQKLGRIADRPDRSECLIIATVTPDGHAGALAEIVREADARPQLEWYPGNVPTEHLPEAIKEGMGWS